MLSLSVSAGSITDVDRSAVVSHFILFSAGWVMYNVFSSTILTCYKTKVIYRDCLFATN